MSATGLVELNHYYLVQPDCLAVGSRGWRASGASPLNYLNLFYLFEGHLPS